MKKHRYLIWIIFLLALLAAFLLLNKSRSTLPSGDSDFAIRDTASVTRVFLADRSGNQIDLNRAEGHWVLNEDVRVRKDAVEQLLSTMMRMRVKSPVAKSAHNSVIKRLSSTGVKVEVYQRVYRIDLPGGLRLFPVEKLTRTIYVGDHTSDNLGTFMLLEGADRPYIVYLPGFRGFVATRFSPRLNDWRDHTLFSTRLNDIASAGLSIVGEPEKSYTVKVDGQSYHLIPEAGDPLPEVDTMKLVSYLAAFDDIRYESLLSGDLPGEFIDSVRNSPVYQIISLTDVHGKQTQVYTHRRWFKEPEADLEGNLQLWDRDRMYAFVEGQDEMVLIQYFVFSRITRPLDWFLPDAYRSSLPEPQE